MFEMYATGRHSIKSLHKFAEQMHLCSSHTKTNKPLGRETIYAMLKNPFYYGETHMYEPLITKTLYDKVQALLSGSKIHTKAQEYATFPFAFRRLIKCAHCGCTISPDPHNNGANTYLRCSHRKGNCTQDLVDVNIALKQLDDEVFSKISLNSKILEPLIKCAQKKLLEESETHAVMKRQITNQLNHLDDREKFVKEAFYNRDITRDKWLQEKANIATKREELQKTAEKYSDISKEIQSTVNDVLD